MISIRALLVGSLAAVAILVSPPSTTEAASFVVDTHLDTNETACTPALGDCTLRGAILNANSSDGHDVITFDIPLVPSIAVNSTGLGGLPTITEQITIDGTTQPGYLGKPIVELNGAAVPASTSGLSLNSAADNSTIKGLVINRFTGSGIGMGSDGNIIQGNYIGVDVTGSIALANGANGITVTAAPSNYLIGGDSPEERNVISGNAFSGITITGSGHTLQGNYIGTDWTGLLGIGNGLNGVSIQGAGNSCFGGSVPACNPGEGLGNVISGNDGAGISYTFTADNNKFVGNRIGTGAGGLTPLSNGTVGMVVVGNNNLIGAAGEHGGNTIAYNTADGIVVSLAAIGTAIRYNSIHSNGFAVSHLGIDATPDGVTANDNQDADTGANNLQNFPVLTSAGVDGPSLSVSGTLNSTPLTSFVIDFYSNLLCDTSGNGEGQTHLGSANVTTDAGGDVAFNTALPAISAGLFLTATATRVNAPLDTSEFSACRLVVGEPSPSPSPSPSPTPTPTSTPTPTPTPANQTPTPTPTTTPTPTQSPTPTPTQTSFPTPPPTLRGREIEWGDHNCSDAADPIDALLTLRFDAGLGRPDDPACPLIGQPVNVHDASIHTWGDVDCSEELQSAINPIDALKILRFDAGLEVDQPPGCPELGEPRVVEWA